MNYNYITSIFVGGVCLFLGVTLGTTIEQMTTPLEVEYIEALTPFTNCYVDDDLSMRICEDWNQTCTIEGNVYDGYYIIDCHKKEPINCFGCKEAKK